MDNKKNLEAPELEPVNLGEPTWEVDDMIKHKRSKRWYLISSIIALLLIAWALFERNYLFALVLMISAALMIFFESEPVKRLKVKLQYNGVFVGEEFYTFQSVSKFYIIYKPEEDIKRLYIEFKNPLKNRLSLPLENENPIIIRDYLLQYLEEDLEKEDEPTSEGLAKILKL